MNNSEKSLIPYTGSLVRVTRQLQAVENILAKSGTMSRQQLTVDSDALKHAEASLLQELTDGTRERRLILWDLVDFYIKNKRCDSALSYLDELMAHYTNPGGKAFLLMRRGFEMETVEDFESAFLCYQKVFAVDTNDLHNQYFMNNNSGYCLNMLGRFKEAELFCRNAIKIEPSLFHNAYKNLGLSLQGQGHYEEAAECYVKATQLCPRDQRALKHLEDLVQAHTENMPDMDNLYEQLDNCRQIVRTDQVNQE